MAIHTVVLKIDDENVNIDELMSDLRVFFEEDIDEGTVTIEQEK